MSTTTRAPIGAHVSVAGGLPKAFANAEKVGAETVQIFVANPRGWAPPKADPSGDAAFRDRCAEAGMRVFVHAPYLINFGSPSAETLAKSCDALEFSLRRGAAIGAEGVVLHAGSSVLGLTWDEAMAQVRSHVLPILDAVPRGPRLLIEPTAGGGGALASSASTLGAYLDVLARDERVGVCLDTCHMHAAGHDMAADFAGALKEYGRAAGRGNVGLVHANDSRDPVGSKRDRHEAIGRGTIGGGSADVYAALFGSTVTRRVPLIVETADKDHATDIATLKALRG
jgi:deoxyribonuclease-4